MTIGEENKLDVYRNGASHAAIVDGKPYTEIIKRHLMGFAMPKKHLL